MRYATWFAILSALLAVACRGGAPESSSGAGLRDSAGIEIVENARPRWDDGEAWRVSEEPLLVLGAAGGDSAQEFGRVSGVARLSDGTIVVADGGAYQLRYFGPGGELVRTAGRKGAGPGEFQWLVALSLAPGDTLLAQDPIHRRLSLFDALGRHVRDVPFAPASRFGSLQLAGRFADGSYLGAFRRGLGGASPPPGPARDSVEVFRLDGAGIARDTLGVFPGPRMEVRNIEVAGRTFPYPAPIPFSPGAIVEAGATAAYVGTGDTYEIAAFDPGGALRRIIRRAHQPGPVTAADQERYRALLDRQFGRERNPELDAVREAMAKAAFPDALPAYRFLIADPDGNLWVAEFTTDEGQPVSWSVFDPGGRWLGVVMMPPGLSVREIGTDYVLGRTRDELDVERVALYRLIKPTG